MKKLLAAVDFSKTSDAVLTEASRLALALGARLWIVHVAKEHGATAFYEASQFSDYPVDFGNVGVDVQVSRKLEADELRREHRELLAISANLRNRGIDAQALLQEGETAEQIVEKSGELNIDIIVLGSHGHGFLRKALLGSVSESVIRHAPCNVMVVPTPGK